MVVTKREDRSKGIEGDFIHLARIALTGRAQDVQLLVHKVVRKHRDIHPTLAADLTELLREAPTRASPLRRQAEAPIPVDADSRLQLLRIESSPSSDLPPILAGQTQAQMDQIVAERSQVDRLTAVGLFPTKSVLFVGPPGVGKTMTARWIAAQIGRPLLILDLAAVISSFLGRTGSNLRHVLDYAKSTESVLLLDEFDAIAKRRDDRSEIGELKRLVTVLLQEVDDWPPSGLLVAATNHPDLLDPAIWRRFDTAVDFNLPEREQLAVFTNRELEKHTPESKTWANILAIIFAGRSFSDVERELRGARRRSALAGSSLEDELKKLLNADLLSKPDRIALARELTASGICSQRHAHEITGVARETIRASDVSSDRRTCKEAS